MNPRIIDLTRRFVTQKVEEIIEDIDISCQSAVSIPQLRQKLIVRVLNYTAPHYALSESDAGEDLQNQYLSLEQEAGHIERLIRDSVVAILREERVLGHFSEGLQPTTMPQEPSHWFG